MERLPADYTFTAADAGVHTFAVTLVTAGKRTVTVTDTGNSSLSGTDTVLVSPAAATHLLLQAPSNVTAGVPFTITVSALDQYNNVAISYTGTIHFTSSSTKVTLPGNYTFVAADLGVHTFTNLAQFQSEHSRQVFDHGHGHVNPIN